MAPGAAAHRAARPTCGQHRVRGMSCTTCGGPLPAPLRGQQYIEYNVRKCSEECGHPCPACGLPRAKLDAERHGCIVRTWVCRRCGM